ncbi:MAG: putative toxin-antitoxin system toxin component, PIN family [Peptococcaceae bacterium]|nr:putative toxin-antitoxin system toxin component, PIN family [Peptococcaceae bacterium]
MKSGSEPVIKAVVDTNVLVSAVCFPGGSPDLVFKAAIRKKYEMITCPFILAEFGRILKEKFSFSEEETMRAFELVENTSCHIVQPLTVPQIITAKPSDNHILACAMEAGADYLVSGDTRHIQPIGRVGGIKIVSPAEFLRLLAEKP